MATQLGAISFVSTPAFVALKPGGGLKWLSYELAVPLGIAFVISSLSPLFYRLRLVSIYELLELRLGPSSRLTASLVFQTARALASSVSVLMGGLVVSSALEVPLGWAILIIGGVTVVYDYLGGIRMVILSDVVQMVLIVLGIVICLVWALFSVDSSEVVALFDPERLKILDFAHLGLDADHTYSFWPMMIGGVFLYASYYGCDQSQVQRQLSVRNPRQLRVSLMVNALGRFPLTLLYCSMGLVVGAAFLLKGGVLFDLQLMELLKAEPDRMVPLFILKALPHGLIGFMFIAILSALMSSLDSALNALSAATMVDVYQRYFKPKADSRHYLKVSRLFTGIWGAFCIGSALAFARSGATARTTIVLINAVGSLFYGPILALFILALLKTRPKAWVGNAALLMGVLFNLGLWLFSQVSWMWWNAAGFAVSLGIGLIGRAFYSSTGNHAKVPSLREAIMKDPKTTALLIVYTFLIVVFLVWLERFLLSFGAQP